MSNLETFSEWREAQRGKLELLKYNFQTVDCKQTSNSAKRLDFENNTFVATICVWESGDVEFDACHVSNGETISVKRASEKLKLIEKLDYYLNAVRHLK